MLKPFDFLFGYRKVISLSSDDVSLQDGESIGSDVMMTSLCDYCDIRLVVVCMFAVVEMASRENSLVSESSHAYMI